MESREDDLRQTANREKRFVALSSLLAAVMLTTFKVVVGLATNSLGILSEAAHSALDLVAAAVTLWAVHISGKPADPSHTYGHGKFENLSALFETLLLLATCVWIIYESVRRLAFAEEVHVHASIWAFVVVGVSIVVDISRSRALAAAARKHRSQALEADALHFSSDIWSSAVVFVGLVGVWLGQRLGWPWLVQADTAAALGVAAIVIAISLRLGKKSVDDLLDTIPVHVAPQVTDAAARVAGVLEVRQVRVRRSGAEVFADVTLGVSHAASFERTHEITEQAEEAVRAVLPAADVVVHVEPVPPAEKDLLTTVRVLAARHGLGAHGMRIYDQAGQRSLELHLEVQESLTLEEAHAQATEFENDLRREVPEIAGVLSHLEPSGANSATIQTEAAERREIDAALREFLKSSPAALRPHELYVRRTGDELAVSFHCTLDPQTAIVDAHDLTEQLEKHLRSRVPSLGRVVIHVEPAPDLTAKRP